MPSAIKQDSKAVFGSRVVIVDLLVPRPSD
jgi:hypothetical protein